MGTMFLAHFHTGSNGCHPGINEGVGIGVSMSVKSQSFYIYDGQGAVSLAILYMDRAC